MNIGILYPGSMGITLSIPLQGNGHTTYYPSLLRSNETQTNATDYNIIDTISIEKTLHKCPVVFVICKNNGPIEVANTIVSMGYNGIVCDANNLWGEESEINLKNKYLTANIEYVEASLFGWPHNCSSSFTSKRDMFLSGKEANTIKNLFNKDYWDIHIIDESAKKYKRLKNYSS